MPLLTFINKWDRPGRDALELLDEIERQIGVTSAPVTWPVGIAGDFRGVVNRRTGEFVRFTRVARGASMAPEEIVPAGAFDPDHVHTPGIYVDRIVVSTINEKRIEKLTVRAREDA